MRLALSLALASLVAAVIYDVPYVHQRWDTGDSFNGDSACGPTSTVMGLAHYGRITKKPIHNSKPTPHENDFGFYVPNKYTSPTGFVFSQTYPDPSGHAAAGAYGSCVKQGGAWAAMIQTFAEHHGNLSTVFHASSTPEILQNAIKAGHLVVQSTQLTSAGHLVLIVGVEGSSFKVNDPWGNHDAPGYGQHINGKNVTYSWATLKAKWSVELVPKAHGIASVYAPEDVSTGPDATNLNEEP
jgi:uncharacterized protein YvpB